MWTKGAVVIIKRGDAAMANAMEKSLTVPVLTKRKNRWCRMKCTNYIPKSKTHEETERLIAYAEIKYGHKWLPFEKFKWLYIEKVSGMRREHARM